MAKPKWKKLAENGVKVLSQAADVAVHLRSNPGPIGLIAVGAKIFDAVNDITAGSGSYFRGWKNLRGVDPLGQFILALCKQQQLTTEEEYRGGNSNKADGIVRTAIINGCKIGWTEYENWIEGPYVSPEYSEDDALMAIRGMIWEILGKSLRYKSPVLSYPILESSDIDETLRSKTADDLWERHRQFVGAGYRRAVLFYGEPGVGKSHIVRHIADQAGGFRLVIGARDLQSLPRLGGLIEFLQPSAVVIDDLDRAKESEAILNEFDEIKAKARLFLVTVNDITKLDPAAVRRFDDAHHIESLDDGVLGNLLKGISDDVAKSLRGIPVTYIDQYRKMHEVLGPEEAKEELKSLLNRRNLVLRMVGDMGGGMGEETKLDDDEGC